MKNLNPDHIQAVIQAINTGPFFKLLSMPITKLGIGFSVMEINLEHKHLNPFGGIHGGVYASVIDTAAFWSVYSDLDENAGLITIDLKIDFLSPVKNGCIIVKGKRIKVGKTICLAEATVMDRQNKMLAHGSSKLMVSSEIQTIREALKFTGVEKLPPKFI